MSSIKNIFLIPVVFMVVACGACNEQGMDLPTTKSTAYTPTEEDIVNMHGDITNLERFKEFVENVNEDEEDAIRIVIYTTEGDAILKDVAYHGDNIKYTVDTTRDGYGQQEITTTYCGSVEKVEVNERIDYKVIGCENKIDEILLIVDK
ncbi:DUF4362 domain-containing protein [Solibacillus sp. FSL H8-0538]|uniref:DUF4362 domain-containing protein n=1 Tax=Solibacillus sp. FSL H8-0538 TaxID=2921400 RepID=UPI0030F96278